MNSKTRLFILSLTAFLILMHSLSFAQTFQYASPNFKITLPPLSASNPTQTSPLPYYTLFIETGNGRYYKNDNIHYLGDGINAIPSYNVFYNYNIQSRSEAILKLVGHYDTIKPPKSLFTYRPFSNPTLDQPVSQNELDAGKRIGFDYSDRIVIPGDTMTLVLTYKPDTTASYMVAFFYNDDNPVTGEKVFSEITTPGQVYSFSYAYGNIYSSLSTKAIRVRGENVYTSLTGLPPQVSSDLVSAKGNFSDAIYFLVPAVANFEEKNIFISMACLKNSQIGTSTNIKAVLIKYNGSGVIYQEPVTETLEIGQFATDPNGIRTTPNCLSDFPGGPFNQPIKYEINFQNDGKGDARDVEVTVGVPQGIQLPSPGLLNVKSTISRKSIVFKEKNDRNIKSSNTYELVTSGGQRKIIFTMPNIKLPGTSKLVNRRDALLRHGTISFTLNTISKKSNVPGNSIKECMYSDVSIVFFSLRGTEVIKNTPITDYDLIREDCKIAFLPCQRASTAVLPPQTQ